MKFKHILNEADLSKDFIVLEIDEGTFYDWEYQTENCILRDNKVYFFEKLIKIDDFGNEYYKLTKNGKPVKKEGKNYVSEISGEIFYPSNANITYNQKNKNQVIVWYGEQLGEAELNYNLKRDFFSVEINKGADFEYDCEKAIIRDGKVFGLEYKNEDKLGNEFYKVSKTGIPVTKKSSKWIDEKGNEYKSVSFTNTLTCDPNKIV